MRSTGRKWMSCATVLLFTGMLPAFGQSTWQRWTFNTNPPDKNNIAPNESENEFGTASGSAPDASHDATDGTHVGVLIFSNEQLGVFSVPNANTSGRKDVFVSMVYRAVPDQAPSVTVRTAGNLPLMGSSNQVITDPDAEGYRVYSRSFSTLVKGGCPSVKAELFALQNSTLSVDDLSIRTTCFPDRPALAAQAAIAMVLFVVMVSLALSWRRIRSDSEAGFMG